MIIDCLEDIVTRYGSVYWYKANEEEMVNINHGEYSLGYINK